MNNTSSLVDQSSTSAYMKYPDDKAEYLTDMHFAKRSTSSFRARLEGGTLPYKKYKKGYFIPVEVINQLLEQNDGNTTGIKIYFGETEAETKEGRELLLDLIFVATHRQGDEVATDFNIPESIPDETAAFSENTLFTSDSGSLSSATAKAAIGIARPCPSQCGPSNAFNS